MHKPEPTTIDLLTPIKLKDLERMAIKAALERTDGNLSQAMRQLGIGRTTIYRKIKKYGILR